MTHLEQCALIYTLLHVLFPLMWLRECNKNLSSFGKASDLNFDKKNDMKETLNPVCLFGEHFTVHINVHGYG